MTYRPATISENGYNIAIDYDASGMRRHTTVTAGNTLVKEKTRVSNLYEIESTATTSRRLDYIYAEGNIVAVRVYENGTGSLYYVLTDHLGSWEKVMNQSKTTVQQTHFDPWGNRMSFTEWDSPQTQTSFTFDRGFTGHEHYDSLHIINANARLYDPVIGRFFSPDPFVQAPDFTRAFNRYSYCMNNPVMYSDEDGEFWHIIAGAIIGGVVNLYTNWENIDNFWEGLSSFAIGAGSGALTVVNPLVGSIAGSAAINAHNEITKTTGQGNGFSNVDWGNVILEAGVGAFTGGLSYGAGSFVSTLKIGNTSIAGKILDVCGVKNLNARTFIGNAINGTLAGGLSGITSGITYGAITGNWDIWNYTWRGAAFGCAGSLAYSGITTLGYEMQLKYGRQPGLDSSTIESSSVVADNAVNQLNTYETPVPTIGVFELQEITIVPNSTTSASVYLPALYHPYLIPPISYQYNSPTFYRLIPLLRIP